MAIPFGVAFFGFATGFLALLTIYLGVRYMGVLGGHVGRALGWLVLGIFFEIGEYVMNALWNATDIIRFLGVSGVATLGIFLNLCAIFCWLLAFWNLKKVKQVVEGKKKTPSLKK